MPSLPPLPPRDAAKAPAALAPGKVVPLAQAIRAHVQPGMVLHLAGGIGGPSAAICELLRTHAGRAPTFTLIQSTVCGHALNLVHAGLVRRLVCAVAAEISGSARPSAVVQRALADGTLTLENWSLLSLQQRLMAAAFGVPFLPTRSIVGSDLAADHPQSFRTIADPFDGGAPVGVVQALAPDLAIVHGCIADAEGNTVLAAPAGEDVWGAFASRHGAIVTVERIVDSDELRRHAALVKIPAHRVVAVCEAPLGLHPFSLPDPGLQRFQPYEKDDAFLQDLGRAARERATLDAWIDEWVRGCATHAEYVERLGTARVTSLHARARPHSATAAPTAAAATQAPRPPGAQLTGTDAPLPPTPEETMLVLLAREIVHSVRRAGHRVVLAGAGAGATATFMAYFLLRDEGCTIELLTGNGQLGYTPVPGESILATQAGVRSSTMLADTVVAQGVLVGGGNNRCLAVLGAGQVDRFGAINSTQTADGRFLFGSGGANDALNASEVIVVLNQSRERFVERLPYRTGGGERVTTVVSSRAVFRKPAGAQALRLAGLFPLPDAAGHDAAIEAVRAGCGWALEPCPDLAPLEPPTPREIDLLRWLRGPKGDVPMPSSRIPQEAR